MAQGIGIGVLVSLLFSVVPLLHVRLVKPSLLLRDEGGGERRHRLDARDRASPSSASRWWRCRRGRRRRCSVGLVVCAGFVALALVLHRGRPGCSCGSCAPLRQRAVVPAAARGAAPVAPGQPDARRSCSPSASARSSSSASGRCRRTCCDEFSIADRRRRARHVPDRHPAGSGATALRAFLDAAHGAGAAADADPGAARAGHRRRRASRSQLESVRGRARAAARSPASTRSPIATRSSETSDVVAGRFWDATPSAEPEVSIEEGLRERFKIHVGDTVRFDILGPPIEARVTSIRERRTGATSRNGGFMFVFRPGVARPGAADFIAPFRGPSDAAARARFQHDLVAQFPNVSVIDFREILDTIRDVMSKVTLAITVVGGLVLFSGVLILIGAVAMTQVPARLRGRDFQDARRQHAADRGDAAVRVRRARRSPGVGWLAGGGLVLTWGVSRYALEFAVARAARRRIGGVVLTARLVARRRASAWPPASTSCGTSRCATLRAGVSVLSFRCLSSPPKAWRRSRSDMNLETYQGRAAQKRTGAH